MSGPERLCQRCGSPIVGERWRRYCGETCRVAAALEREAAKKAALEAARQAAPRRTGIVHAVEVELVGSRVVRAGVWRSPHGEDRVLVAAGWRADDPAYTLRAQAVTFPLDVLPSFRAALERLGQLAEESGSFQQGASAGIRGPRPLATDAPEKVVPPSYGEP